MNDIRCPFGVDQKKWKPYFAQLIKRVGTDDMSRVTEQHLLDWRDALLATKLSPITVRDGYIAAARALFGWAKKMKKLPYNPAVEVFVEVSEKHETEMRGFDHQEAASILSAALAPPNEAMTEENAAARRWVPWLCAYTGARVNEITQLRRCDVLTVDGIECIRITPEAGRPEKTRCHRNVRGQSSLWCLRLGSRRSDAAHGRGATALIRSRYRRGS